MVLQSRIKIGTQEFGNAFWIRPIKPLDPMALWLVFQVTLPAPVLQCAIGNPFIAYLGDDRIGVFEVSDLVQHAERHKNCRD